MAYQNVPSRRRILRELYSLLFILIALIFVLVYSGKGFIADIDAADTALFLWVNGIHHPFWDKVMYLASDKIFWIPGYAVLVILIVKEYRADCWKPLLMIGLLILSADQLSSHLIKNAVERLRPSHETALIPLIHLSKAGPGGLYGFVSSHTANAFSLAMFVSMLLSKKVKGLTVVLFIWAILVSYSRMYNGVHYPADVFFGMVIGLLLGALFYRIYQVLFLRELRSAAY